MIKNPTIFIVALLGLLACNPSDEEVLPGITGRAGELVIVVDNKYWNATTGDQIINLVAKDVMGLPQSEPLFDPVQVDPSNFSSIFKTHRNIFFIDIDPSKKEALEVRKDAWATPQIVVNLTAKDTARVRAILEAKGQKIVQHFLDKEKERNMDSYIRQKDNLLTDMVFDKFGIKMSIPKAYTVAREEDNFMWIRQETGDLSMGLLITTFEYTDTATFTTSYLADRRDEMTKEYIPGPEDGTYMVTYREYPITFEKALLNGKYAAKIYGLWNVEGDFMGGPFINYSFVDPSGNKVVMIDGFIFAPKLDKRNLVRQLDAIISTTTY